MSNTMEQTTTMMTKADFVVLVKQACAALERDAEAVEDLSADIAKFPNIFIYSIWCEKNFERNLVEPYTRKTTFTSDISIAEAHAGGNVHSVVCLLERAVTEWHNNITYFAELIMATNAKAWEMEARKKTQWSVFYSDAYDMLRDLYFRWFESQGEERSAEAARYWMDWLD